MSERTGDFRGLFSYAKARAAIAAIKPNQAEAEGNTRISSEDLQRNDNGKRSRVAPIQSDSPWAFSPQVLAQSGARMDIAGLKLAIVLDTRAEEEVARRDSTKIVVDNNSPSASSTQIMLDNDLAAPAILTQTVVPNLNSLLEVNLAANNTLLKSNKRKRRRNTGSSGNEAQKNDLKDASNGILMPSTAVNQPKTMLATNSSTPQLSISVNLEDNRSRKEKFAVPTPAPLPSANRSVPAIFMNAKHQRKIHRPFAAASANPTTATKIASVLPSRTTANLKATTSSTTTKEEVLPSIIAADAGTARANAVSLQRDSAPAKTSNMEAGTCMFIRNLHESVSERDLLMDVFIDDGDILSASVHRRPTGESTGTAEIVFSSKDDAKAAVARHNGLLVNGKPLRLSLLGIVEKVSVEKSSPSTNGSTSSAGATTVLQKAPEISSPMKPAQSTGLQITSSIASTPHPSTASAVVVATTTPSLPELPPVTEDQDVSFTVTNSLETFTESLFKKTISKPVSVSVPNNPVQAPSAKKHVVRIFEEKTPPQPPPPPPLTRILVVKKVSHQTTTSSSTASAPDTKPGESKRSPRKTAKTKADKAALLSSPLTAPRRKPLSIVKQTEVLPSTREEIVNDSTASNIAEPALADVEEPVSGSHIETQAEAEIVEEEEDVAEHAPLVADSSAEASATVPMESAEDKERSVLDQFEDVELDQDQGDFQAVPESTEETAADTTTPVPRSRSASPESDQRLRSPVSRNREDRRYGARRSPPVQQRRSPYRRRSRSRSRDRDFPRGPRTSRGSMDRNRLQRSRSRTPPPRLRTREDYINRYWRRSPPRDTDTRRR